jgi:hypothetical protein
VPGQRALESDPAVPKVDDSGDQLLKHARVYTIAEKFGLEKLKNLASSKIHCVSSTAKGEIAYARYVYEYTNAEDTTIRAPIANFWATRSHTLRSEAEEEFRNLCLEFPQFGYDVLSMLSLLRDIGWSGNANDGKQPVSWTRSSSARRPRRCTQPPAASASAPGTAMLELDVIRDVARHLSLLVLCGTGRAASLLFAARFLGWNRIMSYCGRRRESVCGSAICVYIR